MAITRLFATKAEIRQRMIEIESEFDIRFIPYPGPDGYESSIVPALTTVLDASRTAFDSTAEDAPGGYYVIPPSMAVVVETRDRTVTSKSRFPWARGREVSETRYYPTYDFKASAVFLVLDGERPSGNIYQSIVQLDDIFKGAWQLYVDIAERLTRGCQRASDILITSGAYAAASDGKYLVGGLNPGDNDGYNLEWLRKTLAEQDRMKATTPTSLLSWEQSWDRLKQFGYVTDRGRTPDQPEFAVYPAWLSWDYETGELPENAGDEDESPGDNEFRFDVFRMNVYGEDFRLLTLPRSYIAKSSMEQVPFSGCDLWETRISTSDIVQCDFNKSNLRRAYLGTIFCACDFTDAILDGADLTWSEFPGCDFTGASFKGTKLMNAIRSRINLTNEQVAQAFWVDEPGTEPPES